MRSLETHTHTHTHSHLYKHTKKLLSLWSLRESLLSKSWWDGAGHQRSILPEGHVANDLPAQASCLCDHDGLFGAGPGWVGKWGSMQDPIWSFNRGCLGGSKHLHWNWREGREEGMCHLHFSHSLPWFTGKSYTLELIPSFTHGKNEGLYHVHPGSQKCDPVPLSVLLRVYVQANSERRKSVPFLHPWELAVKWVREPEEMD